MRSIVTKVRAAGSLVFFGIVALALSGCAMSNLAAPNPIAPVAAATSIDEKAWYAVEAAYNIPAQAYVAALDTGKLPASVKGILRPKLMRMNELRIAARSAYQSQDAKTFGELASELYVLRDQVAELVPGIPKG